MNPKQLKELNKINWWHQIEIDGVKTNGQDDSALKLKLIKMPEDLKGKKVLDVGAWDGFFSFEAEKRGAKVLAIDTITWLYNHLWDPKIDGYKPHTGKKGFNLARKLLKSKVEDKEIEVMDLNKNWSGLLKWNPDFKFDLTLCLGILYHMKDPFGMCQVMYDVTKEGGQLILETHVDAENTGVPAMIFYPFKEWNNDPGTWWGPNPACVVAMLRAAGFKEIKIILHNNHRLIVHAFK